MASSERLKQKARWARWKILKMAMEGDYGHIAPALSCVDLTVALYYEIMGEDDVCILSKGHGALAQYAISDDMAGEVRGNRGRLPGCLQRGDGQSVASTGSLGHGLPVGVGVALARKLQNKSGHVYVVVGDGELQEGSCHEALSLASELGPLPLTVLIDANGLQAMQRVAPMRMYLGNTDGGDIPGGLDGHNMRQILTALRSGRRLLAFRTVKGKGVPFMEGKVEWHYRTPQTPEEKSWTNSYLRLEPTNPTIS